MPSSQRLLRPCFLQVLSRTEELKKPQLSPKFVQCVAVKNSLISQTSRRIELSGACTCTASTTRRDVSGRPREEINNIDSHINDSEGCQFVDVSCSNHCGRYLQRQHLANHIEHDCACRKVNCQYCGTTGEHRFIEGPHKQECLRHPLPCPNSCELPTTASNLADHLKVCPLQSTVCEYHMVGCRARILRQDQKKHNREMMEEHLSLTMKELLCTNSELTSITMELKTTQKKLNETTRDLMEAREQHGGMVALIKQQEETFQKGLIINIIAKECIKELESQIPHAIQKVIATIKHVELRNENARRLHDEPSPVIPVTIKMSGFSEVKESGKEWYSGSFCTAVLECTLQLCVRVNGWRGRSSISVELYNVKSFVTSTWPPENDCFCLKLLNQVSDNEHHSCWVHLTGSSSRTPVHSGNGRSLCVVWWENSFISHESFYRVTDTRQFLKDDCVFFQVCEFSFF